MKSKTEYALIVIRIVLGVILLVAGLSKVGDLNGFAEIINNYHLIPYQLTNIFAIVIPWLEIAVGISLITGFFLRGGTFIGLILFFVFFFAVSWAYARGIDTECGCFGALLNQKVNLIKLIESTGYLIGAVLIFVFYWRRDHEQS